MAGHYSHDVSYIQDTHHSNLVLLNKVEHLVTCKLGTVNQGVSKLS